MKKKKTMLEKRKMKKRKRRRIWQIDMSDLGGLKKKGRRWEDDLRSKLLSWVSEELGVLLCVQSNAILAYFPAFA